MRKQMALSTLRGQLFSLYTLSAGYYDFLFGYRENNFKLMFNATDNKNEVYDLLGDPYETTNLADQIPDFVALGH